MTAACAGEFGRLRVFFMARNMNCPNGEGLSLRACGCGDRATVGFLHLVGRPFRLSRWKLALGNLALGGM